MKTPSDVLQSVINDLNARERRGIVSYGATVDRKDLTETQWMQHAYEEALDLAVYLKKIINERAADTK
jgi:hypothetical protein